MVVTSTQTTFMALVTLALASIVRPPLLAQGFSGGLPTAFGRITVSSTNLFSSKKGGSFNPLTSLIGDMASSLMGNTVQSKPQVGAALSKVNTKSWEEIRSLLQSQMKSDDERRFRENLVKGYGVGSPLHKVRLFDDSNREEDIRVTFYRDSASWCPYCQKVWLALEEKRISYRVEKINMRCYGDKPASFMRMQPSGQIPVAVIDGKTYGQSNDILYALEEAFPNHKSLLAPAGLEMRAQELLRLERKIFSAWMYWLTGGGDSARFRQMFKEVLAEVEQALASKGPFFLGQQVSLVDFMYTPFLERMVASLLYYKGFQIRVTPGAPTNYPAVNRWFDAMETLPSYQLTKSDYYTHCWDLPPQLGGCVSEPDGSIYERAINGERSLDGKQGSWELPLQRHNGGVEPDWDWAGDESAARREAVERVSANHEAIVRFAARGAGRKGIPPVMAPLADPNATPNEAVFDAVDGFMRTICTALLEGTEQQDAVAADMATVIVNEGGEEFAKGVLDSLVYVRDRVGVPRDMKLPAARQLRAHLNWSISKLLKAIN